MLYMSDLVLYACRSFVNFVIGQHSSESSGLRGIPRQILHLHLQPPWTAIMWLSSCFALTVQSGLVSQHLSWDLQELCPSKLCTHIFPARFGMITRGKLSGVKKHWFIRCSSYECLPRVVTEEEIQSTFQLSRTSPVLFTVSAFTQKSSPSDGILPCNPGQSPNWPKCQRLIFQHRIYKKMMTSVYLSVDRYLSRGISS